jgi:two-component system nitrogen regulation response regulator NtrX
VGGGKTISVDVRVLAATNKDLEKEIEAGNFRADLYYRLNVVPINLPPLRERVDDIGLLVRDFLLDMARKGLGEKTFDEGGIKALMSHSWPGNVRELRNLVERAVIMTPGETITKEDLALLLPVGAGVFPAAGGQAWQTPFMVNDFKEARKIFEREFLRARLKENNGNISQTAEEIGLERSHLHKKVKSLGVEDES